MGGNYLTTALTVILAGLLVTAAVTDLRSRIISNKLNLAVALLAPLFWFSMHWDPWPTMAIQVAQAVVVFAVFTAMFALGMMGGGDVKLLAAVALWPSFGDLVILIVLMSVIGGVVTLVTAIHHRMTKRLGRPEIPYGVAISIAAFWVIPVLAWRTIS